jgi:hypothetical protein
MCGAAVQSDDKECPRFSRLVLRDNSFGSHSKSLHLRCGSSGYRAFRFDGGAFHLVLLVYSIDCSHGKCSLPRSFVGFFGGNLFDIYIWVINFRAPIP